MKTAMNLTPLSCLVAIGCLASCDDAQPESSSGPAAPRTAVAALRTSCQADWECPGEADAPPCIENVCAGGKCVGQAVVDGVACSDADSCTSGEHCAAGQCTGGTAICGCVEDSDCAAAGGCGGPAYCDTTGNAPVCRQELPGPCDLPPGPCTFLSCDPVAGLCVPVDLPDGTPCSDGLACTANDECSSGECIGQAVVCEGAGECVLAECADPGGCQYAASSDGVECEGEGLCVAGQCCHPKCTGATCGDDGCGGQCECQFGTCDELAGICRQEGWVLVPKGTYNLSEEAYSFLAPMEQHYGAFGITTPIVVLTHDTAVAKTETTRQEFSDLMPDKPWDEATCQDDCPAADITWYMAVEFANKMSAEDGLPECYVETGDDKDGDGHPDVEWPDGYDCRGYRLPTYGEWWYWSRAGRLDITHAHNGKEAQAYHPWPIDEALLNYAGWFYTGEETGAHPVAQKESSQWGLYDVLGNVPEWVYDTREYVDEYWFSGAGEAGEAGTIVDPGQDVQQNEVCTGNWPFAEKRVLLGGGYQDYPILYNELPVDQTLYTWSYPDAGGYGSHSFGFRLVRTVDLRRAEEVAP